MIYPETILKTADNSGAKLVKCIHLLKASKKKGASAGNTIIVSVQDVKNSNKIKKGEIQRAVIVRLKKPITRNGNTTIKSNENAVILIDNNNAPIGTRIFGPVYKELRQNNFMKLLSLAKIVI